MRKKLLVALLTITTAMSLTGCGSEPGNEGSDWSNRQIYDLTYKFDRAIINLGNGEVIEGVVQSWTDFADGDQIQVKIDGVTYLVHASNITLIAE